MTHPIAPRHARKRKTLLVSGALLLAIGGGLMVVGLASFFMALGSFEPPRYVWCAFLGTPILFVGSALTLFGLLGTMARYMAGASVHYQKALDLARSLRDEPPEADGPR